MRLSRVIVFCFAVVIAWGSVPGMLKAEEFKIAVLQDDKGSIQAYEPLVAHLAKTGVAVTLVKAPTYEAIATMLSSGQVDGVFTGPGIPGSMMTIEGLKEKWFSAGFKTGDSKMQQARQATTSGKRLN